MIKKAWIRIGVATLVLALAGALGWWLYKGNQKRVLQQDVLAQVQDATKRLREAIALIPAGPESRGPLEEHFAALKASVAKLQASDVALNPPLVFAADAYISDVHALARRQLATLAGREAVRADIGAINEHLRAAGTRSTEWIRQALPLKQRLEKSFFDFRLAAGGLEKSLRALRNSGKQMAAQVPAELVIVQQELFAAEKKLAELTAQVERQVEDAGRLAGR